MNGFVTKQRFARFAAALLATAVVFTVSAPTASAGHYGGPGLCGGSEYVKKGAAGVRNANGHKIGRVVISRHRGSDTVCAVTIKRNHSKSRHMSVKIKRANQDHWARWDAGTYSQYAGPVYLSEKNYWIRVRGAIAGHWTRIYWNGYYQACFFRQEHNRKLRECS